MNLFAGNVRQCQRQPLIVTSDKIRGTKCGSLRVAVALVVSATVVLQVSTASADAIGANDPTIGFDRIFGLGGHTCKQYDDTGRLYIYSEGIPSPAVISWLQRSDNGMRANVSMPAELSAALPLIPGCLPGKHHAASSQG
jgi:hypothetical protein